MTLIKVEIDGVDYIFNLAQAARYLGMAESTFSHRWRNRISDDDQESFDYIKSAIREYTPRNSGDARSTQAIVRNETRSVNKVAMDRFLLGVIA